MGKKSKNLSPLAVAALILTALGCSLTNQPPAGAAVLLAEQPTRTPTALAPTLTPSPGPTAAAVCKVTAQALNVRTCGGLACPAIAWLNAGDTVTVTQTGGGWLSVVTAGGLTGWVNANYCK